MELPVRPAPPKQLASRTRKRKILPWAIGSGVLLIAVGITGALVYQGQLTLPSTMQGTVQEYIPVHAPEFHVGDTANYERTFATNSTARIETWRVTKIEDDYITITEEKKAHSVPDFTVFDRSGKLVRMRKAIPDPPLGTFDFPLMPGKTWSTSSAIKNRAGRLLTEKHITANGKVLGWERNIGRLDGVLVDGLKLRIEVTERDFPITHILWYVPTARWPVVIRRTDRWEDNQSSSSTYRLTNFTPN